MLPSPAPPDHRARRLSAVAATVAVVAVAALPGVAGAGTAPLLRATIHRWSQTTALDAKRVATDARQRHPVKMTVSALRFRSDALKARAAIAAQRPKTAAGRRARLMALAGFTDYATAGSRWAATGRARRAGANAVASGSARAAAAAAKAGVKLLVSADALLR